MKRAFQFRLSTLLVIFAVLAICVYFFTLPFSPDVVFLTPEMGFMGDSTGAGIPVVSVLLKNNGWFPAWYRGHPGSIHEFSIVGDPSKGKQDFQTRDRKSTQWICLPPGQTSYLLLPWKRLFDTSVLEVEFRDWRNRQCFCASQEFDFSSVPATKVPGAGAQPPVAIPQGK